LKNQLLIKSGPIDHEKLSPFRKYSAQAVSVAHKDNKSGQQTSGDVMSRLSMLVVCLFLGTACTPTVKVEAPDKPIEINMNINIKHEILIKVEKQVEELLEDDMF
jgi:hypothetical protein